MTYLIHGLGLRCELDLARWALRQNEVALVSARSDSTVELEQGRAIHVDLVLLLGVLQKHTSQMWIYKAKNDKQTFLIVARETPERASPGFSAMHSCPRQLVDRMQHRKRAGEP